MTYLLVRQHSESDCGAASLATVTKYYGRQISIAKAREAVGTGQLGTTLLGLRRGAEALGFSAQPVKASPQLIEQLSAAPLPAIIHWRGYHWVVLYGQRRRRYVVADPAIGIRWLTRQELEQGWSNGVMLLLQPEPAFYTQADDATAGMGKFVAQLRPYGRAIAYATVLNLAVGLLYLTLPFLIQILTDDVLVRQDRSMLTMVVLAVVAIHTLSQGLDWIQAGLITHLAQRLELGLSLEFAKQLLQLPLSYFEAHRSGDVVTRLRDIQVINALVTQVVMAIPSQGFTALVSVILMLIYSPKLTGIALGLTGAMLLPTALLWSRLQRRTQCLMALSGEHQGVLVETFKGALTLKSSGAAPQLWDEFQAGFGHVAKLSLKTVELAVVNQVVTQLLARVGAIALLYIGGILVINQQLTLGQLLAFHSINRTVSMFILRLVELADEWSRARVVVQRLAAVLDTTPEACDQAKPWVTLPENVDICCEQVSFCHTGRVALLDNFSVQLPGGMVTALIGTSGCGKSTLAKLIAGLYVPQSGNIRLGDFNQQDLALDCRRQQIVLVPQEAHFWSRSILDNMRLASPNAGFEAMVTACKIAGADDFIRQLPDQYQTVLGEFGANLSGGQRQRLALARALVNNPAVLILDESTSALDPVTEAALLTHLLEVRTGRTTILISHRPQTIVRADWGVLLEQGRLVDSGPMQELRLRSGTMVDFLAAT
ncbi:MAG: peptidase domain-containing ABC transporter [Cyanobacteria bacterium P01_F01_bin.150]